MPTEYLSGTGQPIVLGASKEALAERRTLDPLYIALGVLAVFVLYRMK